MPFVIEITGLFGRRVLALFALPSLYEPFVFRDSLSACASLLAVNPLQSLPWP